MLGFILLIFFFILFGCDHQTVRNPEVDFSSAVVESFSKYHLQFMSGEFSVLNSFSQPPDYQTTQTFTLSGVYYAYFSQMTFEGREGLYKTFHFNAYEESDILRFKGRWGFTGTIQGEARLKDGGMIMEFMDSSGNQYRGFMRPTVQTPTTKNISGTWDITFDNGTEPDYRWIFTQSDNVITAAFANGMGRQVRGAMADSQLSLAFVDREGETLSLSGTVSTDYAFSGTWYHTKASTAGVFRAVKISDSQSAPLKQLDVANILVDGFFNDWDDVGTFFIDTNSLQDSVSVTGSDLEFVKLATDSGGNTLFFFMKVADRIYEDVRYQINIDGERDNAFDGFGDFRISAEFTSSGWDVVSSDFSGTGFDLPDGGMVSKMDMYIEGSINMTMLGLSKSFRVFFNTANLEPPYQQYDRGFAFSEVYIAD